MMWWLLAAVFLPLYPLSVVFNWVLMRLPHPLARAALFLIWPQLGVLVLGMAPGPVPRAVLVWALLSAALYTVRLLSVRELDRWAGFLACAAFGLGWGLVVEGAGRTALQLYLLGFSVPPALLALLAGALADRLGAAYAGLPGGLYSVYPRWSGILVVAALAAVATPPFPAFFLVLDLLHRLPWGALAGTLAVWLLWSWAVARLIEGFLVGRRPAVAAGDISRARWFGYTSVLGIFAASGIYLVVQAP